MQIMTISRPRSLRETRLLVDHHRLRAQVFCDRLGWDVVVTEGLESDSFDGLHPTYVLAVADGGQIAACARLLPATGPTMVRDVFSRLLPDGVLHAHPAMIESSRFCVDTSRAHAGGAIATHETTRMMFAGIIEWSMANGFSEIVTVTDLRFERLLSRVGWPLQRLGPPARIGVSMAVAGLLPVTARFYDLLRPVGYQSLISDFPPQAA